MRRLPWGHKSRHCVYCGKVGPRTLVLGGYAHKKCLPAKQPLKVKRPCKYGDTCCPCQDGDICHYEGDNPFPAPPSPSHKESNNE